MRRSELDEQIFEGDGGYRDALLALPTTIHQNISFCRDQIYRVRDLSKHFSGKTYNETVKPLINLVPTDIVGEIKNSAHWEYGNALTLNVKWQFANNVPTENEY